MRRLSARDRPCPTTRKPRAKAARGRKPAGRKLRRPVSRLERQLLLGGAASLAGVGLVAGLVWLFSSGWVGRQSDVLADGLARASGGLGLAVDQVLVEGRFRTLPEDLLTAIAVRRGDPILAFDPRGAKARLEALPWVRHASVERRLPALIYLRLEERRPMALWQFEGIVSVIDETGEVIPDARPEDFAEMTLVVGPDAPQHSAALLRLLESEPELYRRVVAAVRVGGRRWNLQFDGGIDVRLPEADAAAAWEQFARIERQHGLLSRDVDSIDLRLPDRLVVKTAPDAEQPAATGDGKNT